MAKSKKAPSIKLAKEKIESIIDGQIDKIIDKSVDKTLDEIDNTNEVKKNKIQSEQKDKLVFALGYFLFFLPLIFSKNKKRMFYANEGLVLLIFSCLGGIFFKFVIGLLHYETALILSIVFYVFVFLCALYGFLKTMNNEKNVIIPFGKIKILK